MAGSYEVGGAHVMVTTEVLESKAGEAEDAINSMKSSMDEINDGMQHTSGYWEGEAGTLYRQNYEKLQEAVQEILKNIQEYPTKLLNIAGVYKTTEQKNVGTSNALKSDLL